MTLGTTSLSPTQIVSALTLFATACYLVAVMPRQRYRRALRAVAVAVYLALLVGAAVWAVLWALGLGW